MLYYYYYLEIKTTGEILDENEVSTWEVFSKKVRFYSQE